MKMETNFPRSRRGGWRAGRAVLSRSSWRREVEEKYERLQEAERLRASLTDMMVHDLRTPLTALLSGLESAECLSDLSPEQQECIGTAIRGGQTLLGMVNDLLDISKMESGRLDLDLSALCVPSLVEGALRQVAPLAERKGLHVSVGVAPRVPSLWGDAGKLTRTLVNLLGNAIKFTPPGGAVSVGASYAADAGRGGTFVLTVSDTGEGIAPEAAGTIFEKFSQAEPHRPERTASSGLGLTFCKMIAEAHGGRIWVESEPGCGSTFSLAIPAQPA